MYGVSPLGERGYKLDVSFSNIPFEELRDREECHYITGSNIRERLLPIYFESGHGEYLVDIEKRKFLDFSAGLGAPCGHCYEPIVRATQRACEQLQACDNYPNVYRAALTSTIAAIYPGELGGVQYYSSGTEAVEAGLRFMRAISGSDEFLSFFGAYHGKTVGSVSLAAMEGYDGARKEGCFKAPYAHCYRCSYKSKYPDCGLYCVEALRESIRQHSRGKFAGIVVEPVQGAGGVIVPPNEYLSSLRELCDEFGVLLMVDEVLTGLGRTGTMFAFEQSKIVPDIVIIGKGLGNGIPITAVLVDEKHRKKIAHIDGGTTYGGNPVSCAAAIATITEISNNGLLRRASYIGNVLIQLLQSLKQKYRWIGDVRGLGCLVAIEFVRSRETKEPYPELARDVYRLACKKGLLTTPIDNIIRLTPALMVKEESLSDAVSILEEVLEDINTKP